MTETPPRWQRPVPTIGDQTSSAQRAQAPDGWALPQDVRQALDRTIGARRDIRRYRPEPIPEELVKRVLAAGHAGPSVGHSQPWRFIIIDAPDIRDRAAVMADRERLRQADLLTPDRRARLLDLQLEGIREAPLGIVIACDRRTPAAGVLGRNTFPDTDMWSCACAIENMWLTARAEGLGMGWVTLFDPQELADLLGLPEGVETLGWLCLGWPDERPPSPGLERRAWSKKLPLDTLIMRNGWQEGPQAPVNALASAHQHMPDQQSVVRSHDDADALLTPAGSLGLLDNVLDRVTAIGTLGSGPLFLVGADHPVADLGVSAFDPSVTREVMDASAAGEGLGVSTAHGAHRRSVVIDAGVAGTPTTGNRNLRIEPDGAAHARGNIRDAAAMTLADTREFIARGQALTRELRSPELVAVGEVGIGNTTPAAIMAARFLGMSAQEAVGLGSSADSAMVARKVAVCQQALARTDCSDPLEVLAEFGGPEFAIITGICLGALENGHAVVLDGLATSVAALAAVRMVPAVQSHLVAGHVSRERAHHEVLTELGLEPLLTLRFRAGEGVGAVLAAQLVETGLVARRTTGRTRQQFPKGD